MTDILKIDTVEDFLEWFSNLNPSEKLDKSEAFYVFFNLRDYEILGI